MSLIASFTIETPILQEALDAVPDMVLQTETIHTMSDNTPKGLVWAWGDDFRTFERNLDTDPTVGEYEHLTDVGDQRLYSITHTEGAKDVYTYPVLKEYDSTILDTRGTHEGLEMKVRFPGREALMAYRETCDENGVPFHLHRLYREEEITGDGGRNDPYGLTGPQQEVLRQALELGYFAIPRQTTQEEIADKLGISVQAVSTRLRRGQRNLLRNTVGY